MKFHILPVVTFLMVVVATNAALSPEFYWKSTLPTTPMPKAITDLLHSDWKEEKDTTVGVGNGGVNVGAEKGNQGGGTDVSVGGGNGGVNVHTGQKGKPVHVGLGPYSPFDYNYAASDTQLRDHPNVALFFMEKDLHRGYKFNLHFTHTTNIHATFLPRTLADSIPFSSNNVTDIYQKLSITPGSDEAQTVKNTISECEERAIEREEKRCVTSLESMVDFATSKLGNSVDAVSTEVGKESELQEYTIAASGVKNMGGDRESVVCHKETYPYAVFYCHKSDATIVYSVPLEGADGNRVTAVAVCHTNTSNWNPKHFAFQVLKVQPGTVPVCHFLPQDHLVFLPK
ncbi:hypothetical protein Fmac_032104 [Flemingia macrophylla]|uniref:BURP domain-containing protein n=1 Tax=Flemingia macrophylla TaxID=520843 RepID=A0ABD1L4D1_9FABA